MPGPSDDQHLHSSSPSSCMIENSQRNTFHEQGRGGGDREGRGGSGLRREEEESSLLAALRQLVQSQQEDHLQHPPTTTSPSSGLSYLPLHDTDTAAIGPHFQSASLTPQQEELLSSLLLKETGDRSLLHSLSHPDRRLSNLLSSSSLHSSGREGEEVNRKMVIGKNGVSEDSVSYLLRNSHYGSSSSSSAMIGGGGGEGSGEREDELRGEDREDHHGISSSSSAPMNGIKGYTRGGMEPFHSSSSSSPLVANHVRGGGDAHPHLRQDGQQQKPTSSAAHQNLPDHDPDEQANPAGSSRPTPTSHHSNRAAGGAGGGSGLSRGTSRVSVHLPSGILRNHHTHRQFLGSAGSSSYSLPGSSLPSPSSTSHTPSHAHHVSTASSSSSASASAMMNSVMVKSVSPAGVVRRGGRNRRKRTKYDLAYKQMELLGPFAEEAKHVDLSKVSGSSFAIELLKNPHLYSYDSWIHGFAWPVGADGRRLLLRKLRGVYWSDPDYWQQRLIEEGLYRRDLFTLATVQELFKVTHLMGAEVWDFLLKCTALTHKCDALTSKDTPDPPLEQPSQQQASDNEEALNYPNASSPEVASPHANPHRRFSAALQAAAGATPGVGALGTSSSSSLQSPRGGMSTGGSSRRHASLLPASSSSSLASSASPSLPSPACINQASTPQSSIGVNFSDPCWGGVAALEEHPGGGQGAKHNGDLHLHTSHYLAPCEGEVGVGSLGDNTSYPPSSASKGSRKAAGEFSSSSSFSSSYGHSLHRQANTTHNVRAMKGIDGEEGPLNEVVNDLRIFNLTHPSPASSSSSSSSCLQQISLSASTTMSPSSSSSSTVCSNSTASPSLLLPQGGVGPAGNSRTGNNGMMLLDSNENASSSSSYPLHLLLKENVPHHLLNAAFLQQHLPPDPQQSQLSLPLDQLSSSSSSVNLPVSPSSSSAIENGGGNELLMMLLNSSHHNYNSGSNIDNASGSHQQGSRLLGGGGEEQGGGGGSSSGVHTLHHHHLGTGRGGGGGGGEESRHHGGVSDERGRDEEDVSPTSSLSSTKRDSSSASDFLPPLPSSPVSPEKRSRGRPRKARSAAGASAQGGGDRENSTGTATTRPMKQEGKEGKSEYAKAEEEERSKEEGEEPFLSSHSLRDSERTYPSPSVLTRRRRGEEGIEEGEEEGDRDECDQSMREIEKNGRKDLMEGHDRMINDEPPREEISLVGSPNPRLADKKKTTGSLPRSSSSSRRGEEEEREGHDKEEEGSEALSSSSSSSSSSSFSSASSMTAGGDVSRASRTQEGEGGGGSRKRLRSSSSLSSLQQAHYRRESEGGEEEEGGPRDTGHDEGDVNSSSSSSSSSSAASRGLVLPLSSEYLHRGPFYSSHASSEASFSSSSSPLHEYFSSSSSSSLLATPTNATSSSSSAAGGHRKNTKSSSYPYASSYHPLPSGGGETPSPIHLGGKRLRVDATLSGETAATLSSPMSAGSASSGYLPFHPIHSNSKSFTGSRPEAKGDYSQESSCNSLRLGVHQGTALYDTKQRATEHRGEGGGGGGSGEEERSRREDEGQAGAGGEEGGDKERRRRDLNGHCHQLVENENLVYRQEEEKTSEEEGRLDEAECLRNLLLMSQVVQDYTNRNPSVRDGFMDHHLHGNSATSSSSYQHTYQKSTGGLSRKRANKEEIEPTSAEGGEGGPSSWMGSRDQNERDFCSHRRSRSDDDRSERDMMQRIEAKEEEERRGGSRGESSSSASFGDPISVKKGVDTKTSDDRGSSSSRQGSYCYYPHHHDFYNEDHKKISEVNGSVSPDDRRRQRRSEERGERGSEGYTSSFLLGGGAMEEEMKQMEVLLHALNEHLGAAHQIPSEQESPDPNMTEGRRTGSQPTFNVKQKRGSSGGEEGGGGGGYDEARRPLVEDERRESRDGRGYYHGVQDSRHMEKTTRQGGNSSFLHALEEEEQDRSAREESIGKGEKEKKDLMLLMRMVISQQEGGEKSSKPAERFLPLLSPEEEEKTSQSHTNTGSLLSDKSLGLSHSLAVHHSRKGHEEEEEEEEDDLQYHARGEGARGKKRDESQGSLLPHNINNSDEEEDNNHNHNSNSNNSTNHTSNSGHNNKGAVSRFVREMLSISSREVEEKSKRRLRNPQTREEEESFSSSSLHPPHELRQDLFGPFQPLYDREGPSYHRHRDLLAAMAAASSAASAGSLLCPIPTSSSSSSFSSSFASSSRKGRPSPSSLHHFSHTSGPSSSSSYHFHGERGGGDGHPGRGFIQREREEDEGFLKRKNMLSAMNESDRKSEGEEMDGHPERMSSSMMIRKLQNLPHNEVSSSPRYNSIGDEKENKNVRMLLDLLSSSKGNEACRDILEKLSSSLYQGEEGRKGSPSTNTGDRFVDSSCLRRKEEEDQLFSSLLGLAPSSSSARGGVDTSACLPSSSLFSWLLQGGGESSSSSSDSLSSPPSLPERKKLKRMNDSFEGERSSSSCCSIRSFKDSDLLQSLSHETHSLLQLTAHYTFMSQFMQCTMLFEIQQALLRVINGLKQREKKSLLSRPKDDRVSSSSSSPSSKEKTKQAVEAGEEKCISSDEEGKKKKNDGGGFQMLNEGEQKERNEEEEKRKKKMNGDAFSSVETDLKKVEAVETHEEDEEKKKTRSSPSRSEGENEEEEEVDEQEEEGSRSYRSCGDNLSCDLTRGAPLPGCDPTIRACLEALLESGGVHMQFVQLMAHQLEKHLLEAKRREKEEEGRRRRIGRDTRGPERGFLKRKREEEEERDGSSSSSSSSFLSHLHRYQMEGPGNFFGLLGGREEEEDLRGRGVENEKEREKESAPSMLLRSMAHRRFTEGRVGGGGGDRDVLGISVAENLCKLWTTINDAPPQSEKENKKKKAEVKVSEREEEEEDEHADVGEEEGKEKDKKDEGCGETKNVNLSVRHEDTSREVTMTSSSSQERKEEEEEGCSRSGGGERNVLRGEEEEDVNEEGDEGADHEEEKKTRGGNEDD
ncbi:hypothetical protein CSUI_002237, partial [Cystoisospora suis]